MKISIASWQQEHSLYVFWGQALSRKFSEWGTPLAVSSLERRTLFTLSFIKIIQRQKYWHFCKNGHSQRGEEAVLEMTCTTVVSWLFRAKRVSWRGKAYIHDSVSQILCGFGCKICLKPWWSPDSQTPETRSLVPTFYHLFTWRKTANLVLPIILKNWTGIFGILLKD